MMWTITMLSKWPIVTLSRHQLAIYPLTNCGVSSDLAPYLSYLSWPSGPESEPFIVTLLSDGDTDQLVSVTNRYLLEKDINGDVIESLDLRCLQSANMAVLGAETGDGR